MTEQVSERITLGVACASVVISLPSSAIDKVLSLLEAESRDSETRLNILDNALLGAPELDGSLSAILLSEVDAAKTRAATLSGIAESACAGYLAAEQLLAEKVGEEMLDELEAGLTLAEEMAAAEAEAAEAEAERDAAAAQATPAPESV